MSSLFLIRAWTQGSSFNVSLSCCSNTRHLAFHFSHTWTSVPNAATVCQQRSRRCALSFARWCAKSVLSGLGNLWCQEVRSMLFVWNTVQAKCSLFATRLQLWTLRPKIFLMCSLSINLAFLPRYYSLVQVEKVDATLFFRMNISLCSVSVFQ